MGYYKKKGCMKVVRRKAAGMFCFDFTSTSSTYKIYLNCNN